jgi:hypothetical protein
MDDLRRLYVRGGAALFALSFGKAILSGFGTHDESWFLQVLDRVRRGDVLYRDVFFGATPLSVQVMLPAVRRFGSEIIVLRAAAASMTAGISLVCCQAAERLGIRDREALALLGLAVAVYSSPADPRAPYSQMAALGQAACLRATVAAAHGKVGHADAAYAGLAAGTSFAAKHNVGLTSLAAVSVSLRLWRRERRSHAVCAGAAFTAVAVGSLMPVLARGAGRAFFEYAVTNKRRYLRSAGLPYLDGLRLLYRRRRDVRLRDRYTATKFLVPPATGLLLLGQAVRAQTAEERAIVSLLTVHGAASTLGAFPRADETHLSYTLPPLIIGLAWATGSIRLSPSTWRVARPLAWTWLGSGVAISFAKPRDLWRSGGMSICRLPHFRGIIEDRALIEFAQGKAQVLRELAHRSPSGTFLLAPDAAQYYLLSGIRNPTPYDFPYVTAFGHAGERATADAIRRGEISTVMIDAGDPQLAAWELIHTTQETRSPIADVGCAVYGPPQLAQASLT